MTFCSLGSTATEPTASLRRYVNLAYSFRGEVSCCIYNCSTTNASFNSIATDGIEGGREGLHYLWYNLQLGLSRLTSPSC